MRRRYTGEQRSALIEMVTAGATVSEAAARLGVIASTAYLWVRQAAGGVPRPRRGEQDAPARGKGERVPLTFARLVRADDLAATIGVRVGSVEVQVRRGFDADVLRAVVQALQGGTA
jgi:transposase-like protein